MYIGLDILRDCNNNDRKAQKILYESCYRIFMPLCMQYNSNTEDARFAFNNAFLKIISSLNNIKLEELNFYAWSKKIITNVLIDEYRKVKNHNTHYLSKETDYELEIHSENNINDAESNFGYDTLIRMIEEIPKINGLVFKLYVIEGYSHREIASQLKVSEGTSKWHLSTARKLLREKLERMDAIIEKRMII